MKNGFLLILFLCIACVVSPAQTSETLSSTTPLTFTSVGSGTYNKTVFYHQTNGLLIDLAKLSDSPSAMPINFAIDARGGGHNFFMVNGSTGNVGIGTSTPNSSLEVLRTSAEGSISVNSSGSTQYSSYGWKAGGIRKWSVYQHPTINHAMLFMNEAGQDVLTIKQDGSVGVGTISPQAKLDVRGASYFYGGRLTQEADLANDNNAVFVNTASTGYGIYSKGGLGTRYAFHFENQAGASIMYGRADGNIGIGTTNPSAALEVQGTAKFIGGRLTHQGDIPNDNNAVFVNSSSSGYGIYSKGGLGTHYAFHFENQSGTSIMYGRGDGNIGIGTTSPDAKLAVKGNIHANEVKVDLLGAVAPDYVFEKDYPLTSLSELKTYIDQNKHLPEIPSAKEMEENGINLKEMNLLLLKKLEEMTLHLIQQSETQQLLLLKIETLESTVTYQQSEINTLKQSHK